MRRATDAQRQELHRTFEALCRIESPSGRERACAEWVAGQLRTLGLEVQEDRGYGGSDGANLFTRIPGQGSESVLLCAHLDTVPPLAPIEPVLVNNGWENANDGILGADNKAAVAVLLELARRLMEGRDLAREGAGDQVHDAVEGRSPPDAAAGPSSPNVAEGRSPPDAAARRSDRAGVELLFTVSEEDGLHGAKAFDATRLQSSFGYVFDHASPIGEIVIGSPTYDRVGAEIRGRAAHAGIRPEQGRSAIAVAASAIAAMSLGRLDPHTTANVGTIHGGTATNVVPERCAIEAEVRGLDERRVEEMTTELIDHLQDAANAGECDLDVTVEVMFRGYRCKSSAREVIVAEQALRACGYEPRHILTGGGSDANALRVNGFPCTNLANGTERNHEPGERVSVDALEGMFEVAIALVQAAGEQETT